MLSKFNIFGIIIFFILQFSVNTLYSQTQKEDSTESWKLIWEYSDDDINEYSIIAFDIYKSLSSSPPAQQDTFATVKNKYKRSWEDTIISPNTTYYYWVRARSDSGKRSENSNMASAAIPIATMDTFFIKSDTSIYLDDYAADKDYKYSQYKDSLSWLINDKTTYTSSNRDISVTITNDNFANFDVKSDSFETVTVYFSVIDPDSFFYKKKTVLKYSSSFTPQPPDTSHPSDSTEYDPEKETLVYPVPFRASLNDYIVFDNLPPGGSLLIFDVMGGLVFEKSGLTDKQYRWNVKNNSGRNINAGLYIFHVRTKNGSKIDSGKVVIIR